LIEDLRGEIDDGRESVLDSNENAGDENGGIVLKRLVFIDFH